jgi:hypothetical protein
LALAFRPPELQKLHRDPEPSAGIVDSQSAKTAGVGGGQRGFDHVPNVFDVAALGLVARHSEKQPKIAPVRIMIYLLLNAGGGLSYPSPAFTDRDCCQTRSAFFQQP